MGYVAISADLVGRVDDHDALAQVIGQHAGRLAQQRGFADARPTHHQDAAPGFDDVANDGDRAEYGTTDPAGYADDPTLSIANRGDAVQGALDAGAIVVAEDADALHDVVDVLFAH